MRALRAAMPLTKLRLVVMSISDVCDQRCQHCDIWRGAGAGRALTIEERLRLADEIVSLGVEDVLITGGEPLVAPALWPVVDRLREGGVRLCLATNGRLLEPHAVRVARAFSEVYVSFDGSSAESLDAIRGAPSFDMIRRGVAALRRAPDRPRLVARCTLHRLNLDEYEAIIDAARDFGFDAVSFLPLDASSSAFGGDAERRRTLLPDREQIERFERTLERLADRADHRGFVVEPLAKLRSLARHLRARAGLSAFERPPCDAPRWSAVVENDGSVRPCFFHESMGDARQGLSAVRRGNARPALSAIEAPNATCERCVCPKRGSSFVERLFR